MKTWWLKIFKNWILIWLISRVQLSFPQSNCLEIHMPMSQSTNLFLYRMIQYPYLLFQSFLRKVALKSQSSYKYDAYYFMSELFFSIATSCIYSTRCQSTSFIVWLVFKWEKLKFIRVSGTWLAENSKKCICKWLFLRFQLIWFQNHRPVFFHQCLGGKFHLCIKLFDKFAPKYGPCILSRKLRMVNWEL